MSAAPRTGTDGGRPGPASRPLTDPGTTTTLDADVTRLLDAVLAHADDDGIVAPPARQLAAALGWSTVVVRGRLAELVHRGALVAVGARALAVAGTPGAALADGDDDGPVGPRTPLHDAVHEGTGSPLLW